MIFNLFQYLYLEGNELCSLPDDFFDKLPKLVWLDLRKNGLLRLPSVYTGRHQNLRNLLLEGNNLRSLPLELGILFLGFYVEITLLQARLLINNK
jgi:Leucine-rich repeat (LRR) protein